MLDLYPSKDVRLSSAPETRCVPVSDEEMKMIDPDLFSKPSDLRYPIQRMKVIALATKQKFNLGEFIKQVKDVVNSTAVVEINSTYSSAVFRLFALMDPAKRDAFLNELKRRDKDSQIAGLKMIAKSVKGVSSTKIWN